MISTRIKVCGITHPDHARAACALGVDALGLVFYSPSPRAVTVSQASEIARAVAPFVTVVALFVDPDVALVERVLARVPVGMLQFHGAESAGFCEQFRYPYLKALRVRPDADIRQESVAYRGAAGILLDAWKEGVPGGTGETFNWGAIPRGMGTPVVLAGGLDAGNVGAAIEQVRPAAVDVSGGVEIAPGEKDARMIAAFVQAVRRADAELNSETDE